MINGALIGRRANLRAQLVCSSHGATERGLCCMQVILYNK